MKKSAPMVGFAICFGLGILAGSYKGVSLASVYGIAAGALFLGIIFFRFDRISTALIFCAVVALGSVYSQGYQRLANNDIYHSARFYTRAPVLLKGAIASDVEKRHTFRGAKTTFTLNVKELKTPWGWRPKSGKVLVNLFSAKDLEYGDFIVIEGKLHQPFRFSSDEDFSYRDYLYRRGIRLILSVKKQGYAEVQGKGEGYPLKAWSIRAKHRLSKVLYDNLPHEAAAIMQAFLLGDRYNIPQSVYELFKTSGTVHIIAISGFNVGIVAYFLLLIFKMFPIHRQLHYIFTIIVLIFYAFLTGGQPPVVRATIMAVIFLGSFIFEREPDSIHSLAMAALILLILNPLYLFDLGFQLSFLCVLSIILLTPRLASLVDVEEKGRVVKFIWESFCVSFAAWVSVVGLILYHFHIITPVVIFANLIIIPLASALIALGMGLLIAGFIAPFLATMFAACIQSLLSLMVLLAFGMGSLPGAYFYIESISSVAVAAYYFCLAGVVFTMILRGAKPSPLIDKASRLC